MRLIAHRGLMNGPDKDLENSPKQIELALSLGYDVEIDVWWKDGMWWLGHDEPKFKTSYYFLKKPGLWLHCKNTDVLKKLSSIPRKINYFWHEDDCYTLTSHNIPWVYPGKELFKSSVCVLPEIFMDLKDVKSLDVYGFCSDYVENIKEILR